MSNLLIRAARLVDLNGILAIVREFAKREVMLPLAYGDAIDRFRDFLVAEEDRTLVGVVAVHVSWDNLVEIRSLAVPEDSQGRGVGRRLMEAALDDARRLGAGEVFALTYIPDFFTRFGFEIIERRHLPQKIWQDCAKCPKFPDCGETAVRRPL